MHKQVIILLFSLLCCAPMVAQPSNLQKRAEAAIENKKIAEARYMYIRAFEDYAAKGLMKQSVECGTKATALYYKENYYNEAFDLLRRIDQTIVAKEQQTDRKAALQYYTAKERMQMYMNMRRGANVLEHLNVMDSYANLSGDESIKNDLLYNKAIYYYTFGQTAKGNAVFKEMADKLTASKEYGKVEDVYKTLIASGRRSNSANMVAQSYSNYIAWKDSTTAIKHADEIKALKKQIADNEATIADKDSSLNTRQAIIIGLSILAAALAAALVLGGIVLMRFILLSRKQKKTISMINENNTLKAKFIRNISKQLNPTLDKLDGNKPEVKALRTFSEHIETLSQLEMSDEPIELEETQIPKFCEELMDKIRDKVKPNVTLTVNAPKMNAQIHREYASHVLLHLLENAAEYTPENGNIWLDFKKRGAHSFQFLVSDTGSGIPEEMREDVFKPFHAVKNLAEGDGLGLPICKLMAVKMNGDLNIDSSFTKGTRFVLDLHA